MLVCPDCFANTGLQNRIKTIRPNFDDGACYAHVTKKGVPLEAVARIIEEVIRNNFHLSGFDYKGEPLGESLIDVIYCLTEAHDHEVVEALQSVLIEEDEYWPPDGEEPFFSEENGYQKTVEVFDEQRSRRWEEFREVIISQQRFFSDDAKRILTEIFDGLHLLRDDRNEPAVMALEPGKHTVFRARRANTQSTQDKIYGDAARELGPPPSALRIAGRMNPSGIKAFYGAFDIETCLAEMRPAVGETIVTAEFRLVRPVVVLDTTKFERPPKSQNIFTVTHNKRLMLWAFMAEFMSEISIPTLPEEEHLSYIPTQVVAEYLVHLHKFKFGSGERTVDGIIFQSAQKEGGKNIVLFGDAANVLMPEDASIKQWPKWPKQADSKPTLDVVQNSLVSHRIESVRVNTSVFFGGPDNSPDDF
ncbi:RES family NAD+ phosphorylase [Tabrizicola sp.]|uniref:RES family NAD+ phosphorylase n=1 Tax=Tabrizicola sp. TaxID=2005166 RepID=UPI00286A3D3D|nr:RES family NAD+ phosphorylase [Tabrizicola sp.]